MQLTQILALTDFSWSVKNSHKPSKRTGVLIPVIELTVKITAEAEAITKHFSSYDPPSLDQMLASVLEQHAPQNAAYRKWLQSRGDTLVQLEDGVLEYLGEAMHRGLRKLADSKQSAITWNALHQVHTSDRVAVWDAARRALVAAFEGNLAVNRKELALTIREAVLEALEDADSRRDETTGKNARTPEERFALRMLLLGCQMTEIDEWVWSWLGYVVKDAPADNLTSQVQVAHA